MWHRSKKIWLHSFFTLVKGGALLIYLFLFSCNEKTSKPQGHREKRTSYVNTFIGTDGPGNTYPGATVPFGMVQLSPDIGIPGWDRIAGYYYPDSIISGFSHTHLTGTGAGDLYDILVMPLNSKSNKRITENNGLPYSRYLHEQESASPGYYQVKLLDFDINAEMTATDRVGVHRYTFPKDSLSQIRIDLGYALNWDKATDTHIKVVDNQTLEGYRMSTGWAKDQRVYFVMRFSEPFSSYTLMENGDQVTESAKGTATNMVLNYPNYEGELVIKTALATSNIAGARKAMENEAPHFNFDDYRTQADSKWEMELDKIHIVDSNLTNKRIFYSMLYQSMLAPTLLSDTEGHYKGANGKVEKAEGFDRYDTFSLWDTYRAAHPLYTLTQTDRVPDFINSLLAHYKETGLLPVWSMQGNETNMMIGYHSVPVIIDAYFKGIQGVDYNLAFEACKASAMVQERQIDSYMELGFIPVDEHHENWSVSKTLEYSYDDWCIAQLAQALGKNEDYNYFISRSENWRNLYDPETGFFRPKDPKGVFIEAFDPFEYTPYFCESNAWQYFFSVQHDIEGLRKQMGGPKELERQLDAMFTTEPRPGDKLPIFSTGMYGQYAHGNEPSHHVAYLYNFTDAPWKTQKWVRTILKDQYKDAPNGHCGNEDCGQMSSWYIFSALGFYPVNPAQGVYAIGSPLFKEASLKLSNGKIFKITVLNNSDKAPYIQSIRLNGQPLKRLYLTHNEIVKGGELEFIMGEKPNTTVKWETMYSTNQPVKKP
ncbi:GH92 family glycosyl hydrolase [Sediminicola luteus]|uniref:Alpha-mannosidase n=1 Tax=Sediminicola luteus TaxID=319238 RepID=A0A2A4G6L6_9FLAO|nr:GH92 family glycosyl hydrolase [Sediminicola luteus]PCE63626.1 alpha-mannosidase [Sediminicola luteus]